jgi:uncharacterized protein
VVDAGTADKLDQELADFERQSSNQILVAVYPKFQSDDSLDDYCYRAFQAWGVGQKGKNNGAVLFVFVQDHTMRIQTGYGLEGALPDILCARIMDDVIKPRFRQGDYAGGLQAGVDAMIAATKGEFKGTGKTVADDQDQGGGFSVSDALIIAFVILYFVLAISRARRGVLYGSGGYGGYGGFFMGGGGGGFGGGGGGGFSGGGGFMGGGGSSGGGGASGSW